MIKVFPQDRMVMFETKQGDALVVVERFMSKYCVAITESVSLQQAEATYKEKGHLGKLPMATETHYVTTQEEIMTILKDKSPQGVRDTIEAFYNTKDNG